MTDQDKAILNLLAAGRTMPQIQGDTGLSLWQIRTRMEHLRRQFGAKTTTALVATAIRQGYIGGAA